MNCFIALERSSDMKRNRNLTVNACKEALKRQIGEGKDIDILIVDGIFVKYVQGMTADEYAKTIGASPIEKTLFGKRYGWDKDE